MIKPKPSIDYKHYDELKKIMSQCTVSFIAPISITQGFSEKGKMSPINRFTYALYAVECRDENGNNLGPAKTIPYDKYPQFISPSSGKVAQYVVLPVYPGRDNGNGTRFYGDLNGKNFLQSNPAFNNGRFFCSHEGTGNYEDVALAALARYGSKGGIYRACEAYYDSLANDSYIYEGKTYVSISDKIEYRPTISSEDTFSPVDPELCKSIASFALEQLEKQGKHNAPILTVDQMKNPEQ